MGGGAAGPFSGDETATGNYDYAYCSQDPCSVYQSCSACAADPMCGWCSAVNQCVEGSASGPWLNKCNKNSFSFDSCAMTVETPAVVTSNSQQANIQEEACYWFEATCGIRSRHQTTSPAVAANAKKTMDEKEVAMDSVTVQNVRDQQANKCECGRAWTYEHTKNNETVVLCGQGRKRKKAGRKYKQTKFKK